jgi:hypothetical protein
MTQRLKFGKKKSLMPRILRMMILAKVKKRKKKGQEI